MVRPNNGTTARILCPCGFRTADSDTICAARFQARRERKTARMERYKTKYLLLLSASILALGFARKTALTPVGQDTVTLMRTPDGGIQPQVAVDAKGVLHLIYFKGSPEAGDIFYVRRDPGATSFSRPLRVNTVPGSAVAIGSVRGAQLAVGKGGRVHVVRQDDGPQPFDERPVPGALSERETLAPRLGGSAAAGGRGDPTAEVDLHAPGQCHAGGRGRARADGGSGRAA